MSTPVSSEKPAVAPVVVPAAGPLFPPPDPNAPPTADHTKCMARLEVTIATNWHAQKILDGITELGCKLPPNFFVCRTCEQEMTGGFLLPERGSKVYNPKIIMCENKQIDTRMFQNTVIHELIHAYDICRAKVDWNNCRHYACTEIRASSLRFVFEASGD
jgi:Peptidase M76 family